MAASMSSGSEARSASWTSLCMAGMSDVMYVMELVAGVVRME